MKQHKFKITIEGKLAPDWVRFPVILEWGNTPTGTTDYTTLTGIMDQTALRGVLNALWDINLNLVAVQQLPTIKEENHEPYEN